MILVTGAAGKTGRAVIRALAERNEEIRGLVHRKEQLDSARHAGAQEAVLGDFQDVASLAKTVEGIEAIYHICSNVNPDEVVIGERMLGVAKAAGVRHFVYHSVLHPQTESMPHHWKKMRVEEKVFESGMAFTILQPTAYMQNVLAQWENMVNKGVYPVPYRAEARLSIVDLQDVAQAAAIVLTQDGHENAIYELCGPDALSQLELVNVVGGVLGREVKVEVTPLEVWEQRSMGMPAYARETLLKMFCYYDRHGLVGNANVLRMLLGREPTSFEAFMRRERKSHEEMRKPDNQ